LYHISSCKQNNFWDTFETEFFWDVFETKFFGAVLRQSCFSFPFHCSVAEVSKKFAESTLSFAFFWLIIQILRFAVSGLAQQRNLRKFNCGMGPKISWLATSGLKQTCSPNFARFCRPTGSNQTSKYHLLSYRTCWDSVAPMAQAWENLEVLAKVSFIFGPQIFEVDAISALTDSRVVNVIMTPRKYA
jgi:hypothetical protein